MGSQAEVASLGISGTCLNDSFLSVGLLLVAVCQLREVREPREESTMKADIRGSGRPGFALSV